MQIYISCVSEQDPSSPKTHEEGSLLTCFRYLKEKKKNITAVYFIPTSKNQNPDRNPARQSLNQNLELSI